MRLTPQVLSAVGNSPWMIPDPLAYSSAAAFDLCFSSNANLTAAAQYTYDDPAQTHLAVTFTRAGAVLTVNSPNHLLNVGDTCDLQALAGIAGIAPPAGGAQTNFDVTAITDQNNFTVACANAGILNDTGFARLYRLFTHATLTGTGTPPARVNALLGVPAAAVRLHVSVWTAGSARLSGQETLGN